MCRLVPELFKCQLYSFEFIVRTEVYNCFSEYFIWSGHLNLLELKVGKAAVKYPREYPEVWIILLVHSKAPGL